MSRYLDIYGLVSHNPQQISRYNADAEAGDMGHWATVEYYYCCNEAGGWTAVLLAGDTDTD